MTKPPLEIVIYFNTLWLTHLLRFRLPHFRRPVVHPFFLPLPSCPILSQSSQLTAWSTPTLFFCDIFPVEKYLFSFHSQISNLGKNPILDITSKQQQNNKELNYINVMVRMNLNATLLYSTSDKSSEFSEEAIERSSSSPLLSSKSNTLRTRI